MVQRHRCSGADVGLMMSAGTQRHVTCRTAAAGVAALCLLITACHSTVELSRGETEATDYVPGAVYVLLQDRYLESRVWPPGVGLPDVVANSIIYYANGPSSIDEFRADPSRWPHILGVLTAGTRLRLQRIVHHRYPGLDDWYTASAVVVDGEFGGRDVELLRISAGVPNSRMLRVDPQELQRITADPDSTQVP